jgi:hypothetical protein
MPFRAIKTLKSRIAAGLVVGTIVLCAICSAATPPNVTADGTATPPDVNSLVQDLKNAHTQADLLNEGLAKLEVDNSPLAWLKALNLQFKAFEPSAPGKNAALGIDYSYAKAVTDVQVFRTDNPGYLTFSFNAKGNVSFDKNNNPADFLQTGIKIHLWQYFGQTKPNGTDANGLTLFQRTLNELTSQAYSGMSGAQIRATPQWQEYAKQAYPQDPIDFFYDLAGNVSLESNQTFSKKQWAYGAEFQPRLGVYNPESPLSKFNIFDWPFAVTRMLSGEPFQPSGRYLPSVMVGIDLVDPVSDADRFKVDPDKSAYPRFKAEVGLRAKVVQYDDKIIWFNAGYRFFQEIDASSAIRAAHMNQFTYFAASLTLPWNVTITYTNGKLPFDLRNQQVWALGYKILF